MDGGLKEMGNFTALRPISTSVHVGRGHFVLVCRTRAYVGHICSMLSQRL